MNHNFSKIMILPEIDFDFVERRCYWCNASIPDCDVYCSYDCELKDEFTNDDEDMAG